MYIIGVTEKEERKMKAENFFEEIMVQILPNLVEKKFKQEVSISLKDNCKGNYS